MRQIQGILFSIFSSLVQAQDCEFCSPYATAQQLSYAKQTNSSGSYTSQVLQVICYVFLSFYIRQRGFFMKDGPISVNSDTKYMTVLQIGQVTRHAPLTLESLNRWTNFTTCIRANRANSTKTVPTLDLF